MRKVWAHLASCVGVALVLAMLVGCGGNVDSTDASVELGASQASAVEGLHTDGVLTVGLRTTTGEPLVRRGTSSVDGLYVDVAGAMADQLGLSVRFVEARSVKSALQDECDIVMDVSADESEDVQVVGDITESAIALFSKANGPTDEDDSGEADAKAEPEVEADVSAKATVTAQDLAGMRVAIQESSASQRALQLSGVGADEVACDSLDDAFLALRNGEVDYVACGVASGAYLQRRYEGVEFAGCLTEPVAMGIALAKGAGKPQDTLIAAFKGIDDDGVLQEVRRRWLGDFPRLTSDSQIDGLLALEQDPEDEEEDPWAGFDYGDYDSENLGSSTMDGSSAGANAATISKEE